jgi:hypothetical protein
MPYAFVMDFAGGTTDQYDRVISKMNLGGKTAPNSLFHWVAPTEDGLRVVDVWETVEAFNNFAETQIGPLTAAEGLPAPTVTPYEVHNYLSA